MASPMPTADVMTGNTLAPTPLAPKPPAKNFSTPASAPNYFGNEGAGGYAAEPMQRVPTVAKPPGSGAIWNGTQKDELHETASNLVQAQMQIEGTGPDPNYPNIVSGFRPDTWLNVIHAAAPQTAQLPDEQVLAMRNDPKALELGWATLNAQNATILDHSKLPVTPSNIRLMSWMGPGGAQALLRADPNQPINKVLPNLDEKALKANNLVSGDGSIKTVGQVLADNERLVTQGSLKSFLNTAPHGASSMAEMRVQDAARRIEQNAQTFSQLYSRIASQTLPGSAERERAIGEAHEERRRLIADYDQLVKHPPSYKPIDALQNFGSMGSILGMIAGLFARNHMTTALNASGKAIMAANSNNKDQFDRQMQIWDHETNAALKMIDIENQDIKMLLEDKRMAVDEKNTQLQTLATVYGIQNNAFQTGLTASESMARLVEQRERLANGVKEQQFSIQYAQWQQDIKDHPDKNPSELMQKYPALLGSGAGISSAGRENKPVNVQWVDKDGKTQNGLATYDPKTRQYTPIGQTEPLPLDTKVAPGPSTSGNRVQPQIQRLLGAGSQMEAHLTNLSEMPIGGSIGAFMGLESKTPETLSDALARTAARKTFTSDEIKAMQNEFIGVGRQIAALDSQGAATGLVGLSKQAEGYAPNPDDSPIIVMRKYASLRQIVEQAMNGVLISGTANPDQKAGAREIVQKIEQAIPYTVHDINQIQFGGQRGSTEAATEIINRRRLELATAELLKHRDDPIYRESFKRHFPNVDMDKVLGDER